MDLARTRFLLDENVPIKLKRVFVEVGLICQTIKDLGWCGLKDHEIASRITNSNYILITRDKDFTFVWQKKQLSVIYLAIEPVILDIIEPRVKDLIQNWVYDVLKPFLLIVQNDLIRYWQ
jgi:predicted nuclease of predicted toxin-antitoxin system